jgi:DNA-binding NarL/FixJ family response regulator
MVSTNICIEWHGKRQKFQLILWRDMTGKFKDNQFSAVYTIGKQKFHYLSVQNKFKEGDFLSEKEAEILVAFKQGFSSKQIAENQNLSPFTVDNHKKNVLSKLNTNSMDNVLDIMLFCGLV